jgi:hypothetical protein
MSDLEKIESRILSSRKYSDIHPSVVVRQIQQLKERFHSDKSLEQAVRRKLHQASGAYLGGNSLKKLEKGVKAEGDLSDAAQIKAVCRDLMVLHASTRERLTDLEEIAAALGERIPEGSCVVDLACGLNALTLPWLFEHRSFHYTGFDLHRGMLDILGRFAERTSLGAEFVWGDVLSDGRPVGDVALMLKLLPCLEHQEEGSALRLVAETKADVIVVSYPTRSIGGQSKGMDHTYHRQIEIIADTVGRDLEHLAFETEAVFVMRA